MRPLLRRLIWGLVIVVGVVAGLTILLRRAAESMCAFDVLTTQTAPGGEHDAVVFQVDCGATTGISPQLSVLERGEIPKRAGNVLTLDDDFGGSHEKALAHPVITVRWLGPRMLAVAYDTTIYAGRRELQQDGVRITYEHAPYRPGSARARSKPPAP